MTVPTISTVTPALGPTGGWTLVEIVGTGFRTPTAPPPTGPVPARPRSVAVYFGTASAKQISVASSTKVYALSPVYDIGTVGVTLTNVDDAGVPIPGETVTKANAFTFQRPKLTDEDNLSRLIRALIREVKRQVIENVQWVPHTDWSDMPASGRPAIATLPAIVLSGPGLSENRTYSINWRPQEVTGLDSFKTLRFPLTCDLEFTVMGVSDSMQEALNLLALTAQCFHRTKWLEVQRHPTNPALGIVRYELDVPVGGGLTVKSEPSDSNIRQFNGRIVIRGFDFEGLASFDEDRVVDRGGRVAEDGVILQSEEVAD